MATGFYLTVEKGISSGVPLVASEYPVAWDLQTDSSNPGLFRISWPNSEVTWEMHDNRNGTPIQLSNRYPQEPLPQDRKLWRLLPVTNPTHFPESPTIVAEPEISHRDHRNHHHHRRRRRHSHGPGPGPGPGPGHAHGHNHGPGSGSGSFSGPSFGPGHMHGHNRGHSSSDWSSDSDSDASYTIVKTITKTKTKSKSKSKGSKPQGKGQ